MTPGGLHTGMLASLDALRGSATRDPRGAVREAAKQFESIFMQELMKSMRATTMSSGLMDNTGTTMGTEMLDQQYAGSLAGRPGGLADMIARQLERQMGIAPGATSSAAPAAGAAATPWRGATAPGDTPGATVRPQGVEPTGRVRTMNLPPAGQRAAAFVQKHQEAARATESATGIPANFVLAQAAHETGWGRREIRDAQGRNSHNLFGIKAGAHWKGPVAEITTTEVVNGVAHKVKQKFRAYASYEEGFKDYARLLTTSPRYAGVVARADDAKAFAQGLQRAGYATDPAYARKLGGVIETTQRLQREMGRWL